MTAQPPPAPGAEPLRREDIPASPPPYAAQQMAWVPPVAPTTVHSAAVDAPTPPVAVVTQHGPSPVVMLILGLVVGLLIGLGVAYALWHSATA